ncbi:GNAT family N-acetyltransferase [Paenibacillus sp. HB172176]|uniref:GNAT family N-acetyltransferase n=1 Tax=Paenibacillus sp. HB172176 TaxID=2493690 RepID=UPI00143CBB23|nr:GNAT family N-acetyltransferase [Paenibacillus sp. HB172176]
MIRELRAADGAELLELHEFAFQYAIEGEAERQRWLDDFDPEGFWGCFVQGKLAAALHIANFEIWLNGRKIRSAGIGSVATSPEYRRLGLARNLLTHAITHMREQGIALSLLHPFNISFYRRFGWEQFHECRELELMTEQLPRWGMPSGAFRVVSRPEEIYPVYEAYAQTYNGMLSRSPAWWEKRVLHKRGSRIAAYETDAGEMTGYLYYQVREGIMTVHELVATDNQARRAIWKFIGDHDSMIKRVSVRLPMDDPFPFMLGDMKLQQRLVPFGMIRIVDAADFLARYPFSPGHACTIRLHVRDETASWNEAGLEIKISSDGEAEISRKSPETFGEDCLSCSIGTLSLLVMGNKRPSAMASIGALQGGKEQIERLEKALLGGNICLIDAF